MAHEHDGLGVERLELVVLRLSVVPAPCEPLAVS